MLVTDSNWKEHNGKPTINANKADSSTDQMFLDSQDHNYFNKCRQNCLFSVILCTHDRMSIERLTMYVELSLIDPKNANCQRQKYL